MSSKHYKKGDPITSYGVINIHLSGELSKYNETLQTVFGTNANINIEEIEADRNTDEYRSIYKMVEQNLLFLLVSRKHSLGYIEFLRGNYDISDNIVTSIQHLFDQMTENEIQSIFSETFDALWCGLWKKNAKKATYTKEYLSSVEKFNFVRSLFDKNSFKPIYPISEWGFPKGRKNANEPSISCAIRECCEETSLVSTELSMLTGVNALVEDMVGTNNVKYKHVYYLSVIEELRNLSIRTDIYHFTEIDTAGWFKKNNTMNLIRPYHTEKLRIIDEIVKFIAYVIHCNGDEK